MSTSAEHTHLDAWTTDTWRAEATRWIDARLSEAGVRRIGEVEQPRVRPWGTVLRAETGAGRVWLKATAPATAFEVGLYPILHAHAPEAVLAPIATDPGRGWLLLPDGGAHLGDVLEGEALIDAMAVVLPRYAEMQRTVAPAVAAMLAAGVLDMRPAALPGRFDEALAATGEYAEQHGTDEDRATHRRIAAARPMVVAWSERLAASPVPASIDHDDLHARNVLVRSAVALDTARFFDWGDSVVAHPFTSALVALRAMQALLRVGPDDPALLRLRDAYLEPFGDLGSHRELVETLEAACHAGKIARALVWHRAIGTMPPEEAGEFADAPLYWLAEILDDSWLGGLEF
jgi:hypothetical protein